MSCARPSLVLFFTPVIVEPEVLFFNYYMCTFFLWLIAEDSSVTMVTYHVTCRCVHGHLCNLVYLLVNMGELQGFRRGSLVAQYAQWGLLNVVYSSPHWLHKLYCIILYILSTP